MITRSQFIRKLNRILHSRFADPDFTSSDLAKAMGMSRAYLHRHLRRYLDRSATEVIRAIRITHAKKMLARSDYSIREIAHKSGFKDSAYFSRVFRREIGWSPQKYRAKLEEE